MFCQWMPWRGQVVEDQWVVGDRGHQHLQGPIQLQDRRSLPHHNPFHNPHPNRKAASGEA